LTNGLIEGVNPLDGSADFCPSPKKLRRVKRVPPRLETRIVTGRAIAIGGDKIVGSRKLGLDWFDRGGVPPMGSSMLYQAIPPGSEFYKRMQADRPFALLVASLFPYGSRPLRFFEENEGSALSLIEMVCGQYAEEFGSGVVHWSEEFRGEIGRIRASYAGIEDRAVWLHKSHHEIQQGLLAATASWGLELRRWKVERMFYGEGCPDSLSDGEGDESVSELPAESLRESVKLLDRVSDEELFGAGDEWYLPQFTAWKSFYAEAAELGEAVFIRYCG
jgi:hypothetical protein